MNKVYVVLIYIPYEGSSIQDIFSTKEKAVCIEYKVN